MNLVPNCGIKWKFSNNAGTLINEIPTGKYFKNIRENSFHYVAPRLFNKLPRTLRDNCTASTTLLEWKMELDKFLEKIPDNPIVTDMCPGLCDPLTAKPSNSLIHWIPNLGLTSRR